MLQMAINLRHHVVVLDEAHNIEDCSRDAASCTVFSVDLQDARDDIDKLKRHRIDAEQQCTALVRHSEALHW